MVASNWQSTTTKGGNLSSCDSDSASLDTSTPGPNAAAKWMALARAVRPVPCSPLISTPLVDWTAAGTSARTFRIDGDTRKLRGFTVDYWLRNAGPTSSTGTADAVDAKKPVATAATAKIMNFEIEPLRVINAVF